MPRPVILFSGSWADLSLDELAAHAAEWGYNGLELACWGDHFEVQRAAGEDDYVASRLEMLRRLELDVHVLACHRVSQVIADVIDDRHRDLVPDHVWGDGSPEGVRERATQELIDTVRGAQAMGVGVVSGFSGSPIWSYVVGYPSPRAETVAEGLREFARRWSPILDVCAENGIRYAFEVHPGQIAFDYYTAEMVLDELGNREEFGFTFDPVHLHWQGVDPVAFVRRFGDRIYHVHVKDVALTLDGRGGLLGSYLPYDDHRRGWHPRAPGHGSLDWEGIMRALNAAGYQGALSVEWQDPDVERTAGAEEALEFVRRLDFPAAPRRR